MPYEIKQVQNGYKVFKKGTKKSFSKQPLPKKRAVNQMKALYAAEESITSIELSFSKLFLETIQKFEKTIKI